MLSRERAAASESAGANCYIFYGNIEMTTLEEISKDAKANYSFWTNRARLNLVCFKHSKCLLEKAGFRSCMKHRRLQTYLEI